MAELHVLRVFCGAGGTAGNPLGVVLDGAAVPPRERQSGAARIGFSETVFVDDLASGTVRIFTPAVEMPFAGHPLVGTAWLLATERSPVSELNPPAGAVPARVEDDRAYVVGRPEWAPEFEWAELGSAADVVIFDCPALRFGADAAALAARSDGVILVIDLQTATRGSVREALRRLEAVRARVLGFVLNHDTGVGSEAFGELAAEPARV